MATPAPAAREAKPARTLRSRMHLPRWTPLVFAAPDRFVEVDDTWAAFPFERWSRRAYEWTSDGWNGFRDVARHPVETTALNRGDCEDYALVAASWARSAGRADVGLGFCWEWPYPWPTHVVAYDDERVYSSGDVTRQSVAEWVRESTYRYCLKRPLDG